MPGLKGRLTKIQQKVLKELLVMHQRGLAVKKYFIITIDTEGDNLWGVTDIKAEITRIAEEESVEDSKWTAGLRYSLKIIDKHISGKE